MTTRREFNKGIIGLAFAGLASNMVGCSTIVRWQGFSGYGQLNSDADGILDLPEGFNYKVISQLGHVMSDGLTVPDRADGMGCLKWDEDRVVLVRNHELSLYDIGRSSAQLQAIDKERVYDSTSDGAVVPGGTTNILFNMNTGKVEREFLSLVGTIRNCSGGVTPWKTWLSCEESVETAGDTLKQDHGYVFEVPADATELIEAKPLKAMGRFNHEAAAVDPKTGIVYMTEDRGDSLFYRFIPDVPGQLDKGGQLQAMAIKHFPKFDSRNWESVEMPLNERYQVHWIDLDEPESPKDDLRLRGYDAGCALFARGEGIHWADDEVYFCCTNGGHKQLGQIMKYKPSRYEGEEQEIQQPGEVELFFESNDASLFNFGDNLTVSPNGHLIVCEDQYTEEVENYLRIVTEQGQVHELAKVRLQTEPAGACFSPDGTTLFVNLYSPTKTLAITGPWFHLT